MSSPSRRQLLGAALGGAAVLGLPPWLAAPAARAQARSGTAPETAALGDDLHLVTVGGVNVIARTGAGGVVLVDGGSAEQATTLLDTIVRLPGGGPVGTLFNTCWHRSQTGLNETLGRAGATIIAHENAKLWQTTEVTWPWDGSRFAPVPDVALPNKTFYSKETLVIGAEQVEYGHVRACPHTDGDAYVYFRDANVLAVGDAIAAVGWPSIDWRTGGWIGGVVGALELLAVLADGGTRIVTARGPVLRRADVEAQHAMFDLIYERLVTLLYGGKSPDEAVAARPLAEFEDRLGPSDEFVRQAFQSLWGYLTPDA